MRRVATLVESESQKYFRAPRRAHCHLGVGERRRDRLLAQHGNTGGGAALDRLSVQMVGRRDIDRVKRLAKHRIGVGEGSDALRPGCGA